VQPAHLVSCCTDHALGEGRNARSAGSELAVSAAGLQSASKTLGVDRRADERELGRG